MKKNNLFSEITSTKWDCLINLLAITIIVFVFSFVLLFIGALLNFSMNLGNLISSENGAIYGLMIMCVIAFGIYLIHSYYEIKEQEKYLPIESTEISNEQYQYVLNRISKLIRLYQSQLYCSTNSYYREANKRFSWTIDKKKLYYEDLQMSEAENRIHQLCNLKDKIYLQNLTNEDIYLLNKLLNKRSFLHWLLK